MIDFISSPWPWYVSGPLITIVMFLLIWLGGQFGMSSTLRHLCAIGGAGNRSSFFDYNWKEHSWSLVFALGTILGGFIASFFLNNGQPVAISESTVHDLSQLGIIIDDAIVPKSLFNFSALFTFRGLIMMILGGFMIGFGTRWAGGCTSGHAISGLSNLQLPSLVAVIGFFIGGLICIHLIYPILF